MYFYVGFCARVIYAFHWNLHKIRSILSVISFELIIN